MSEAGALALIDAPKWNARWLGGYAMREIDSEFFDEQATIAGFRHQGLLLKLMVGSDIQTSYDTPCLAAAESTRYFSLSEARLLPGEFPTEALIASSAVEYVGQVLNGGHGQYFGNMQLSPWAMDACENGLARCGADDYLSIFRRARALFDEDLDRGYRLACGMGFGEITTEIRQLDHELFSLEREEERPIQVIVNAWLEGLAGRGLISIETFSWDNWKSWQSRFLKDNAESIRRNDAKEQRRLSFPYGYCEQRWRQLCALAQAEFIEDVTPMWRSLRMIHPSLSPQPELVTGFETSRGDAYMFLLCNDANQSNFRASLYQVGRPEPLSEIDMPVLVFRHLRQSMR